MKQKIYLMALIDISEVQSPQAAASKHRQVSRLYFFPTEKWLHSVSVEQISSTSSLLLIQMEEKKKFLWIFCHQNIHNL